MPAQSSSRQGEVWVQDITNAPRQLEISRGELIEINLDAREKRPKKILLKKNRSLKPGDPNLAPRELEI